MVKITDVNYNADMPKEMIEEARQIIIEAFEAESQESAVATVVKREFMKKYKGVWHCVVGKNFGSYVTHEMKGYIHLTWGQMSVLLWKSVS
ncbi:dynein light chain LC8-type [Angomonas deanei]|uniref:Dynein light chain n=1 Tax=Angomonas deanei TaxID=59799 RepID=S9WZ76_9TRYP|nr:dynein light chain LC8-type [Angomonas deanei]EPY41435.1 dynein light chain LC8-type [Angomonas deanei]CAD2222511.1 Dynein light chain type 1, putative [Angomonas deanei]|eukprot:EPY35804.1 dynein light chain LC8-type [Angomonas deanei]